MKRLIIMGSGCGYSDVNKYLEKSNSDYEVWGCATNLFHKNMPKFDLIFEIHEYNEQELSYIYNKMKEYKNENYITHSKFNGIKSEIYPIDEITSKYGKYFCSSFAFMTVLAIERGYEEIMYFGIDYAFCDTNREAIIEKANLEYWIGKAEGKGLYIDTYYCPFLCRSWKLYGWEKLSKDRKFLEDIRTQYLRYLRDITDDKTYEKIKEALKEYLVISKLIDRM